MTDQMGLLAMRPGIAPREAPAESEFGSGSWFIFNALNSESLGTCGAPAWSTTAGRCLPGV